MKCPDFFNDIENIELMDPLGGFLGAFDDGIVEISYLDCVKLSGHSCPTVASAYVMTKYALVSLYGDATPHRSTIKVELQKEKDDGVTGVIGSVAAFIVGAGDIGGFKGIGGKFARDNLLAFGNSSQELSIKFTRLDNSTSVEIDYDTSIVPGSPDMMPLMQKSLKGDADTLEKKEFQVLWQERVLAILTDKQLKERALKIIKGQK